VRSASALKRLGRIRVGLVGPTRRELASCIQALRQSPDYQVIGCLTTGEKMLADGEAVDATGHRFASIGQLVRHPDVDLVAVLSDGPGVQQSARLAALAGKDVYIDSLPAIGVAPLVELSALAQNNGVRNFVGLPRRLSPANRFIGDRLANGYVGKLRSASLRANIGVATEHPLDAPGESYAPEQLPAAMAFYAAEFLDAFFSITGPPLDLFGVVAAPSQPHSEEDGSRRNACGQLCIAGRLADDAVFSVHFERRKRSQSTLTLDVAGEEGKLKLSHSPALDDRRDRWLVEGGRGENPALRPLAIPKSYTWLSEGFLSARAMGLANIYAAFARDLHEGTNLAPTLEDAIRLFRLTGAVAASAEHGQRISV
jgi:predicted dehydrogenase